MTRNLKVTWYRPWHPLLDEALKTLPEDEECPHDILKALALNPGPLKKETALVTADGTPVAVIPLRQFGRRWEFIGHDILARSAPPALPAYRFLALAALKRNLYMWGTTARPPAHLVRNLTADPIHVMDLKGDFEGYWRKAGNHKSVVTARKRASGLDLLREPPGGSAWAIEGARRAYGAEHLLSDNLLAASLLAKQDRYRSFALCDGDRFVAGATVQIVGNTAVGMEFWALPEYRKQEVGVRNMDFMFHCLAEDGLEQFDLRGGTGFEYKARWAPATDQYWGYWVTPAVIQHSKAALMVARRARQRLRGAGLLRR
jgi:Acetyltransferase (GNAT) domain